MTIQCGIIRDLLPLYHDSACSPESRAAVEQHISGCAVCAAQLLELETPLVLESPKHDAGAARMRKIKHRLMRRTVVSVLPVLAALWLGIVFLTGEFERIRYLPYDKIALSAAWNGEDETVQVNLEKPTRFVAARCWFLRVEMDGEWKDVAILRLEQSWTRKYLDYSKDGAAEKRFGAGTNLVLAGAWGQMGFPWFDPAYEPEFWNPNWEYPGNLAAVYYLGCDYPGFYGEGLPDGCVLVWER